MMHSLQRRNFEIHKISDIESEVSTSLVGITLLSGLGGLEVLTNLVNLLFCFSEDVGSKNLTLSYFRAVQRGATLSSVHEFKWGHLQTGLITIVVGKFCKRQTVFPLGSIFEHTCSKHIFEYLIYSLRLSIGLRVIRGTEISAGS